MSEKASKGRSILDNSDEKEELDGKSIINEENTSRTIIDKEDLSDKELQNKLGQAMTRLGENGMMIFVATKVPINDREKRTRFNSASVYQLKPILVGKIDITKTRGYIRINDEIDVPILNIKGKSEYFFDKDEVIEIITRNNRIEKKIIDEEEERRLEGLEDIRFAKEFMEDIVKNNKF